MSETRSVSTAVSAWAQTLAILATGLWAGWTFYFKEVFLPAATPVNQSMQMSLSEVGGVNDKIAIQLRVTATNPTQRTIHILSNMWSAQAMKIGDLDANFDWRADETGAIAARAPIGTGRYFGNVKSDLVAAGSVFPDSELKPSETIARSFVFYVPKDAYDSVSVETMLPTASKGGAAEAVWTLEEGSDVTLAVYRLGPGGKKSEMPKDANGSYTDGGIELQMASSSEELSLWGQRGGGAGEAPAK